MVIGGGASGLAAAITAARAGKSVCIVERDVACGLKLLATGNGRCNLSNESIDPQRYNHPAFVESVMGPQPEQELYSFFSSLGIMTTSEEGRLYPRSLRAESVRDALLNACNHLGITLICGANVASAFKASEGWTLQIDRPARALKAKKHDDRKTEVRSLRKALADTPRKSETLQAKAVIIATGGSPADIAKTFNLSLTPQHPVLCPVSASVFGDQTALKTLDGLRVRARLTLTRNHEELWREDGEVLFRTFGISGVAAFNLSRRVQRGDTILLDVFPDLSKDELLDMLNRRVALLGGFSPATPLARRHARPAVSPRRLHSVRDSAIGSTMSSIWSRSSNTLSCSSRERRGAQPGHAWVAYLSRASPPSLAGSTATPRFTSVVKRSTSTPIAEV
ncbi:MAG: NAD(P)/FAD-dependent oxidoreductase [Collinsella sp.]